MYREITEMVNDVDGSGQTEMPMSKCRGSNERIGQSRVPPFEWSPSVTNGENRMNARMITPTRRETFSSE